MENNNNVFLGKIERAGCYVNNGKYGYFLTCNKKNYKLPEFLLPEEVTLDMAKRLIAYKQKISQQWLENQKQKLENGDISDNESSEEPITKNYQNEFNFFLIIYIMFGEIQYKLFISGYMTKDGYKQLIKKYMDEFNVSYITAKRYLLLKQIKQFEHDKQLNMKEHF